MNKEALKTGLFVVTAAVLVVAAVWVEPEARTPEVFSDQGETLLPKLRDVMAVKDIEVVDYDESEAVARPLKVEFKKGRWIMPSHYDYPAEAGDQLAKAVAALVGVKKDIVVSNNVLDHAQYGVVDPLDTKVATLRGRGKHVTLRGASGEVLADLIEGYPVKSKPGYRYVRIPGEKRVYAVKTDADPSARFEDWVGGHILQLSTADVRRMVINAYSIDEQMGSMSQLQRSILTRQGDFWTLEGSKKVNGTRVKAILGALGNLRIAGVRPKPPSLADELRSAKPLGISLDTMLSLRQRGYFLGGGGRLLAGNGEMTAETKDGVVYTLRFGAAVTGLGAAADSPSQPPEQTSAKAAPAPQDATRYLWVTTRFDSDLAKRYGGNAAAGERASKNLSAKFADWYYIINAAQYTDLRALPGQLER